MEASKEKNLSQQDKLHKILEENIYFTDSINNNLEDLNGILFSELHKKSPGKTFGYNEPNKLNEIRNFTPKLA